MKKTLVVKLNIDISGQNDMQTDLMKAMILAGYPDDMKPNVSFELLVDDELERTQTMLRQVRAEFRKRDK